MYQGHCLPIQVPGGGTVVDDDAATTELPHEVGLESFFAGLEDLGLMPKSD